MPGRLAAMCPGREKSTRLASRRYSLPPFLPPSHSHSLSLTMFVYGIYVCIQFIRDVYKWHMQYRIAALHLADLGMPCKVMVQATKEAGSGGAQAGSGSAQDRGAACTCMHMHMHMHTCRCIHVCIFICLYLCTYLHIYIYVSRSYIKEIWHMCIRTHTHTHTHMYFGYIL